MGRNLFCVHSKKHLDDVPELKAERMATNRRTLKAMQTGLNEGGKLLWIAPSGGRDRSEEPTSGGWLPSVAGNDRQAVRTVGKGWCCGKGGSAGEGGKETWLARTSLARRLPCPHRCQGTGSAAWPLLRLLQVC